MYIISCLKIYNFDCNCSNAKYYHSNNIIKMINTDLKFINKL